MNSLATVDSARRGAPRERAGQDWYREPEWAVHGLFDVHGFDGGIYDPACGAGTILRVARAYGYEAIGSDVVDRGAGLQFWKADFLVDDVLNMGRLGAALVRTKHVVTNPPFSLAEDFLRRALRLTAQHAKIAMLLRLSFLEGRRRRWIFDETPLAAVHPFAARVSMPPGGMDVQAKGGAVAFAWLVWSHDHQGPPILRRIERGPS